MLVAQYDISANIRKTLFNFSMKQVKTVVKEMLKFLYLSPETWKLVHAFSVYKSNAFQ